MSSPSSRMIAGRGMTRAEFLRLAAGAAAGLLVGGGAKAQTPGEPSGAAMPTRPIPSTQEPLPVIGLGTYVGFDVQRESAEYRRLPEVLRTLFEARGSVIDTSPMYGRAEAVTGELLAAGGLRSRAFVATKVWTRGRAEGIRQMQESMRLLQLERLDLMQVHNLIDWRVHLSTLRDWQAAGRVRYVGVTHYTSGAYGELEAVMREAQVDFLQINYSVDEREAERRILPLAAERGMAVLINRPFGGGGVLRRLRDRPLPPWAAEIGATSWAQVLLKFVLSHSAVTCAIPGTGRAEHVADNVRAAFGTLPDAAFWKRHVDSIDA
ncbi:aldo/keto reductase [Aromatoleum toluclasticum]|uniref:aldo/keto reductase n=1 Tax=Aromatoleum toluclasticum TaxID=92003 RepID=UPI001D196176|nr:aldo/keto reductase [Aromatoleum toluclasticum]MCC4115834.1 aldo/keto reductase [Aromatoleum toluclasticum]